MFAKAFKSCEIRLESSILDFGRNIILDPYDAEDGRLDGCRESSPDI